MRKFLLSLCFGCLLNVLFAQDIHLPEAIHYLLEQSSRTYVFDSLNFQKDTSDSFPLINNEWQIVRSGQDPNLRELKAICNETAQKYLQKGEKYKLANKYKKAIKHFKEALSHDPANIGIMKYLAECYRSTGDHQHTFYWYEEIVKHNFTDYNAHLELAHLHHKSGDIPKMIRHITMAHLFNINDPQIIRFLKLYFEIYGLTYNDWVFDPQYHLYENDKNEVVIQSPHSPWQAYAACKALWKFDHAYKMAMSEFGSSGYEVEQMESLLNALIVYDRMEEGKNNYPELAVLSEAVIQKKTDDFVLYEIEARKNPLLIYQLPKARIESLTNYLLTIRSE